LNDPREKLFFSPMTSLMAHLRELLPGGSRDRRRGDIGSRALPFGQRSGVGGPVAVETATVALSTGHAGHICAFLAAHSPFSLSSSFPGYSLLSSPSLFHASEQVASED